MRLRTVLARFCNPKDTAAAVVVALLCLAAEALLSSLIVARIPYTEIDWVAYMEQVEGMLQGERDFSKLRGSTGPLVYPAGFLLVYRALHWLTNGGDVKQGQICFMFIYLANQVVVLWLYVRSRAVPPWVLPLLCLSKRIHSIFLLRLFNDGIAMLLAYCATAALVQRWTRTSLVLFSAGVAVKMNVLLFAPPVLVVLLMTERWQTIAQGSALGVALQLCLGAPFLLSHPGSYLSKAFELSRVFLHTWSVNLKFLPEPIFQSKLLAAILLITHISLLWAFAERRWCARVGGLSAAAWMCLSGTSSFPFPTTQLGNTTITGSNSSQNIPGDRGSSASHIDESGTNTIGNSSSSSSSRAQQEGGPSLSGGARHRRTGPSSLAALPEGLLGASKPSGKVLQGSSSSDAAKQQSSAPEGADGMSEREGQQGIPCHRPRLPAAHVLLILFSGNFLGILCARTLHFQFYSWYFHTLPFMLWQLPLADLARLSIWLMVEVIWNVFPSTALTSLALLVLHSCVGIRLWRMPTAAWSYLHS
ncbi:hypothetical protein WJX74_007620 [Apatococcus lobatus]|uniref:dolichyl-P-Man:Man5GlcNAc2-PP-dolichol alpha-1,3-mannosyltransferase n=1 Tax=Apatococcus lobatus TaxID=904363 RepID=A0AAW1QCC2_9CHLO